MNQAPKRADASVEALLAELADDFMSRLERGERPDAEDYARRHPALAAVLRQVLPALGVLRPATTGPGVPPEPAAGVGPAGRLGDFLIRREVGRGGMGLVYEAEQLSLGRRVALKVLPFAAALDPRQLQRFQNEAQAAACLHHQHIVPVYAVGCEQGVYYYAMQFISGRTLADLIAELRRPARVKEEADSAAPNVPPPAPGAGAAGSTAEAVAPGSAPTTERSARGPAFFQTVAQLGVQAAEALEHAHQQGVVHRDVKPANLMVDARGHLWVTDFGLAQVQSDARLTLTGDLVGTLRYMSPEQALGKRVVLDQRTDVYSLGVTLYELLTLEPAYPGTDRQGLLRQIAFDDPRPPRRLNRAIPAELETIVLKAAAKAPAERYGTAQELADDLRRWLNDKPIKARRPTLRQGLARWLRRHRTAAGAGAVSLLAGLLLTVVVLAVGMVQISEKSAALQAERDKVKGALELAKQEKEQALQRETAAKGALQQEQQRTQQALEREIRAVVLPPHRPGPARMGGRACRPRRPPARPVRGETAAVGVALPQAPGPRRPLYVLPGHPQRQRPRPGVQPRRETPGHGRNLGRPPRLGPGDRRSSPGPRGPFTKFQQPGLQPRRQVPGNKQWPERPGGTRLEKHKMDHPGVEPGHRPGRPHPPRARGPGEPYGFQRRRHTPGQRGR
jgi:eukaryotic-like serine/threonine-protein kinase